MYGELVMPGQSIFTPLFGVTGKQRDMALLPPWGNQHRLIVDNRSAFFKTSRENSTTFDKTAPNSKMDHSVAPQRAFLQNSDCTTTLPTFIRGSPTEERNAMHFRFYIYNAQKTCKKHMCTEPTQSFQFN